MCLVEVFLVKYGRLDKLLKIESHVMNNETKTLGNKKTEYNEDRLSINREL